MVQEAIRAIKARYPDFYVITDVCMCEYTDHGHCGILSGHEVDNDSTLEVLSKTALSHAQAGGRHGGPLRHDGRPGGRHPGRPGRKRFPECAHSGLLRQVRLGVLRPLPLGGGLRPSFGDRKGYQMDPHNRKEALKECELDIAEGADLIMVKPALSYLDVIRECADSFDLPLCAYSVSGEYAMIKAAAAAGLIDEYRIMCESALSVFRAGGQHAHHLLRQGTLTGHPKGDVG